MSLILPALFGTATANCTGFNLDKSYTTIAASTHCTADIDSGSTVSLDGTAEIQINGTEITPTPSFDTPTALKVIASAVPRITFLNVATNYTMKEELLAGGGAGHVILTPYSQCVNGTSSGCSNVLENGKSIMACMLMEIYGGSDAMGEFNFVQTS